MPLGLQGAPPLEGRRRFGVEVVGQLSSNFLLRRVFTVGRRAKVQDSFLQPNQGDELVERRAQALVGEGLQSRIGLQGGTEEGPELVGLELGL